MLDDEASRLRSEPFFRDAARFLKRGNVALRARLRGLIEVFQRERREESIEIFPAQVRITERSVNLVHGVAEVHNRCVEGAAAEVIDDDALTLRIHVLWVPVKKLKRCRRRLIHESYDLKPRAGKGIHREKTLCRRRVRGDTERNL